MPSSSEAFLAGLVDDLTPVTPLRQRRGMGWAITALASGAVALVLAGGLRQDFAQGAPSGLGVLAIGLFLILTLAAAWAVVDMARPQVGTHRNGWFAMVLLAGLFPVSAAALIAANLSHGDAGGLHLDGTSCMRNGLFWSLLTAGTLVAWLRRGAPVQLGMAGLLTGLAAGSAGVFAVSFSCPSGDMIHIGIWHGLTVVLAGLIGRLAVPPLVRW